MNSSTVLKPTNKTNNHTRIAIKRLRKKEGKIFLSLINALAAFEKLKRPSRSARARLLRDAFGRKRRFDAFLAIIGKKAVGYAIFFETYSSFLALPTLYLEDIFILPEYRSRGIGLKLFHTCMVEAERCGCGRMEWVVLDWNKNAIKFYNQIGARQMKEWLLYRIEQKQFRQILQKT
ncbi:MAG: GNAT family N-acetyltransferase [Bacteroidota bacterium]|nr:GNAT family N-acetyltransferase [Bacteroidota bacterium]